MPPRPARRRHRSSTTVLACATCAIVALAPSADATAVVPNPVQDDAGVAAPPRVATLVRNVRALYGSLEHVSVTLQVDYDLPSLGIEDLFDVRVVAERPNRIAVRTNVRYYTTNEFISDGETLFEWAKRRERWSAQPAPADFDAMRTQLENHRMVNAPVDLAVALLSSDPIPAMLQIAREPGALTVVGEEEIRGVRCAHLRVGAEGAEAWIALDGKPWVMRYRPTASLLDPRVLPPGIALKGPLSTFDFIDWRTTDPLPGAFEWSEPEGVERLPTLHESIDDEVARAPRDVPRGGGVAPSLTRAGSEDEGTDEPARPLVAVGETLPDLRLLDLEGQRTTLAERIGDREFAVVLVWAGWNKLSSAWAQQIGSATRDSSVALVPIAFEQAVDVSGAWVRRRGVLEKTLVDSGGALRDAWGVAEPPVVLVIDRERTILRVTTSYTRGEVDALRRAVDRLVEQNRESDGSPDAGG